jgi:hypothetical protein
MSTSLADLAAELSGQVPGYSPFLAQRDINRAWRDIVNRRTWSFLIKEGGFNAPVLITAGTVTIVQNSANVIADATATTALQAVAAATPPLTKYQFRISSAGGIYNIVSWTVGTNTLVVDRPILEASKVGASYMSYQCYFPGPPQALQSDGTYDFNRWISIFDPVNGYVIKDGISKAWVDARDPQRSTTSLAYRYFDYKPDSLGNQFWEFWPHPTSGQEYVCLYKARGLDFSQGLTTLPAVIPDSLLLDRALVKYVYRWCAMNAGRFPNLAKTNWAVMTKQGHDQWELDLQKTILEDENLAMQAIVGPMNRWGMPPIDSNFLQSHSSGLEAFGI